MKQSLKNILSIKHFNLLFIFVLFTSSSCPAMDNPNSIELPGTLYYSFEGSTQYDRLSSTTDTVFPLFFLNNIGTYLFGSAKQTFHSKHGAKEFNYGIGLRQLCFDSFILGINLFYDKRISPTHNHHYQQGYGFEFLSKYIDARFNYYDPINKTLIQLGSAVRYSLGSSGVMSSKRSGFEETLEGFDFELGGLIPIKKLKTRLYAGASLYDSKLADHLRFFNIRTETRITDWFILDFAMRIPDNHHRFDESDKAFFTGGFRIEIPFEAGNLFKRKNPIRRNRRKPKLKNRLFERVVRDIDIQIKGKVTVETKLEKKLIYVNNQNQSGIESGSLEKPFSSLTNALASPRYSLVKSLYLFKGDGSAYVGNYTLDAETLLWGSGTGSQYNIPTQGYPILESSNASPTVTIASNTELMGLQITGPGTNDGIYGLSLENTSIHKNIITGNDNGIGLSEITGTAQIYDNTISKNSRQGIYGNSLEDIIIYNNTISENNFDGIFGILIGNAIIYNNTISENNDDGIYFNSITGTTQIYDNTISENNGDGIFLYNLMGDVTLTNNTISANNNRGIYLRNLSATAHIYNNMISANSEDGIYLYFITGTTQIYSNTIENNTNRGINADLIEQTITLRENTVSGNDVGAYLSTSPPDGEIQMIDNVISGNITDDIIIEPPP